ncbi:MAG: cupin domain-containing protein [candidate division Zixibacteria bacterium]|nr:cupin domain-containing protein [candidate division Zixibacteria bacterium]
MKIRNLQRVEKRNAYPRGKAKGVSLRVAIAEEDGAQDLTMRIYEVDPGGYTPLHSHPWEHALFVVRGSGKILDGKNERRFERNDVLFIPADEKHQIKNNGEENLVVVSVIPIQEE